MRDVPRPGRSWLRSWKEHEGSGSSLTGSPEAARCPARSGNFGRQGWNAPVQEFAQRGPDSRFGGIHSFTAPKEIVRTLVSGVSAAAIVLRFSRSQAPSTWLGFERDTLSEQELERQICWNTSTSTVQISLVPGSR